jgi:hypothetical protein
LLNLNSLSKKIHPIKIKASNNFVLGINKHSDQKDPNEIYANLMESGIEVLNVYVDNTEDLKDKELLLNAADIFSQAANIKKDKAEPYFYLSYIFYLFKNINLSIKYLNIVSLIEPKHPGLTVLKENMANLTNKLRIKA